MEWEDPFAPTMGIAVTTRQQAKRLSGVYNRAGTEVSEDGLGIPRQ